MLRRWCVSALVAALTFMVVSLGVSYLRERPAVQDIHQPGPLIIVGMPTLSWADASGSSTPALWRMARMGATASLITRNMSDHSCSNQSWLTLSAGTRTTIGKSVGETPPGAAPGACPAGFVPELDDAGAVFPDWAKWRTETLSRAQPANIGRLGTSLARVHQCISAAGPAAALGAANTSGRVAHYWSNPKDVNLTTCPVTMISLDAPDDTYLAALTGAAPKNATIVVTGVADDTSPECLRAVAITGPGVAHGLLTSVSTRQRGVLQTVDLSALVLARLGDAAPNLPAGRPPVVQPSSSPTASVTIAAELAHALEIEHAFVGQFFVSFLVGVAAIIGSAALLLRHRRSLGRPVSDVLAAIGCVAAFCAAMPVSTFLVNLAPWWRGDHPRIQLAGGIVLLSAVISAVALLGPWRRWRIGPMLTIAAVTWFVIAQDVVHGSPLQLISMMGMQPVYGGRFYGQGNVGYALFATTGLLLAALLAGRLRTHRQLAMLTVVLIGLATLIIDGYPTWGADGGGPLAMLPAFAYLALNAYGVAVTWRRILLIGGVSILVVSGLAVLDYLRPPEYRTHLGDFVAQLRNNGQLTGIETIWKANWTMLTSSPLTLMVPVLMVGLIVMLLRPDTVGQPLRPLVERVPMLGQALAAITVCWLIAFFSNDSGTAIPPAGMLILIPLLIVLAVSPLRAAAESPRP